MKPIALLLISSFALLAGEPEYPKNAQQLRNFFVVRKAYSSATAEKTTIQLPANTSGSRVRLIDLTVYCSVACTVTQERDGTAATTTSVAPVKLNAQSQATLTVEAYASSNVGSAAYTYAVLPLAAGQIQTFDLEDVKLIGTTGAVNYSVAIASATGTYEVIIRGEQY